jgi:hypothetical protein
MSHEYKNSDFTYDRVIIIDNQIPGYPQPADDVAIVKGKHGWMIMNPSTLADRNIDLRPFRRINLGNRIANGRIVGDMWEGRLNFSDLENMAQ